ncbi:MAG: hypothetical protein N2645_09310 [Clostridia bacterium]|nr:hypothetical protein [Clostridia bacterium]
MKKIWVLMILMILAAVSFAACSSKEPKTVQTKPDQTASEPLGTPHIKYDLFSLKLSDYMGLNQIIPHTMKWSPKNKYIIFEALNSKSEAQADHSIIVADMTKGSFSKLGKGDMRGSPSWSPDERMVAVSGSNGLYLYHLESGKTTKISENGFMPNISPDQKKVAYMKDGIWIFDVEKGTNKLLSKGQYNMAPNWFSDSKRIFFFRDTGKNLGDGAGNEQVMSILDTDSLSTKDIYPSKKGKFRSSKWLKEDHLLNIYAGWDDGHYDYILDLNKYTLIEARDKDLQYICFDPSLTKLLRAGNTPQNEAVEIFDFSMNKIGEFFISQDNEYKEATQNLGLSFIEDSRVVYLHVNSEDDLGAIMISEPKENGKQTRITPYGHYSEPYVSDDGKLAAYVENGGILKVLRISEVKGIPVKSVPGKNFDMLQLLRMFPDKVGTSWIYSGFAEYGHDMKLDGINPIHDEGKEYLISGKVHDMSDGEATGDFSLALRYIFLGNSVKEIIDRGEKLPHKIKELEVLKTPLAKGNTWAQSVNINGQDTELKAVIVEDTKESDSNKRIIKVEYTAKVDGMPDGIYKEIRVFKEGVGLISFQNTYNKDIEFSYGLYKIK